VDAIVLEVHSLSLLDGVKSRVENASNFATCTDSPDRALNSLTKRFSHYASGKVQRECLSGIKIEERAHEYHGDGHVHFVFGVDTMRPVFCFQGERKDI